MITGPGLRYNKGLRGRKSSVYEGGIKVPAFIYSPALLPSDKVVTAVLAHIDLLPTILDFAHLHYSIPTDIDGISFAPLIYNSQHVDQRRAIFSNRTLFWQEGRGYPVPYQNMAVRQGNYKLVANTGYRSTLEDFELYNLQKDPDESNNIISSHRQIARSLKKKLVRWYQSIIHNKVNRTARWIQVGTRHENPVILDRNDARGHPRVSWKSNIGANIYGFWNVQVKTSGLYTITFKFAHPIERQGTMQLKLIYPYHYTLHNKKTGITTITMPKVPLEAGKYRLVAYYQSPGNSCLMPWYVKVRKVK